MTNNPLSSCVSSLHSSNQLLASSISILDSGVNDFPRLSKVVATTRHFELLPSSTLTTAQSSLVDSLTPEIDGLLARVETHLDRLERRELALIARCELLEGRLGRSLSIGAAAAAGDKGSGARARDGGGGDVGGSSREVLRLKQMRAKKERLGYAVERLVLQAQQRERQLRMSIAGT